MGLVALQIAWVMAFPLKWASPHNLSKGDQYNTMQLSHFDNFGLHYSIPRMNCKSSSKA